MAKLSRAPGELLVATWDQDDPFHAYVSAYENADVLFQPP
jgi:hypothetical protein